MLANQGLYLGAALPLAGAFIETQQQGAALALFWLTLATCISRWRPCRSSPRATAGMPSPARSRRC